MNQKVVPYSDILMVSKNPNRFYIIFTGVLEGLWFEYLLIAYCEEKKPCSIVTEATLGKLPVKLAGT